MIYEFQMGHFPIIKNKKYIYKSVTYMYIVYITNTYENIKKKEKTNSNSIKN